MSNVSLTVLHFYSSNQLTALRVTTLALSVLGLLGNVLVVLVILSRRKWRFANSMFILNIAIANLFICAFTLPLMTRALFDVDWEPLPQFCQVSAFLDNTAFACSSWSLALGSVERFFLVVFPMSHRRWMKYQKAVLLSVITWALSVCLSVLPILGWNEYIYSKFTFTCGINTNLTGFHMFYFIVYLGIVVPGPLVISTTCYSYILCHLRVHYTIKPHVIRNQPLQQLRSRAPSGPSTGHDTHASADADMFGSNVSEIIRVPPKKRSRVVYILLSRNMGAGLSRNMGAGVSRNLLSRNLKIVMPMILITIAFNLCFLPNIIVGVEFMVNPGAENGQPKLDMIEYFIIHLLLLGNSAITPLIFTMTSSKFRTSSRLLLQLLLERVVLVLFYLLYVLYYSAVTLAKVARDYWGALRRAVATCRCVKGVAKYDSLNDVVIKITITNSEGDDHHGDTDRHHGDTDRHHGEEGCWGAPRAGELTVSNCPENNKTSETIL